MKKSLVALSILMALVINTQTTFAACHCHHSKYMMKKHHHHALPMRESFVHRGCPLTDPCPCRKTIAPCPCGAACPISCPCAAPCPCQPACDPCPCQPACPCPTGFAAPTCNDCCD